MKGLMKKKKFKFIFEFNFSQRTFSQYLKSNITIINDNVLNNS